MRPSFTVSGLMAAVVALGLVALRDPGLLTASLVFSLALAILLVAGILGCARRGRARAGWLGMAGVGLAYLHFAFAGRDPGYPALVTTAALARVFDQLPGSTEPSVRVTTTRKTKATTTVQFRSGSGPGVTSTGSFTGSGSSGPGVSSSTVYLPDPDPDTFIEPSPYAIARRYARGQVGQSLMAILVGLLGGLAGRTLADRDDPAPIGAV